jgi:hypothetical protein
MAPARGPVARGTVLANPIAQEIFSCDHREGG